MQHLLFFLRTQEMMQMTQTRRRGLSASQKQELWARWKRGQSRNDIARSLAEEMVEVQIGRGHVHGALPLIPGAQRTS
jgi:hypothetical protein